MLNIPTRSDAMRLDKHYAQAVRRERLQEELKHLLTTMVSPHYINGHVIEAFQDAGIIHRIEAGGLASVARRGAPRKVRQHLKPALVLDRFTHDILSFRSLFQQSRDRYDREVPINTPQGNRAINPYEIGIDLINNFHGEIIDAYNSNRRFLDKLAEMDTVRAATEKHPHFLALLSVFSQRGASTPGAFESSVGRVRALFEEHREIQKRSDIILGFEELTFIVRTRRGTQSYPSWYVLDEARRFHSSALRGRVILHQLINDFLFDQNYVVFNGVIYTPTTIHAFGRAEEGFAADSKTHMLIADLFGAPIQDPTGLVIYPNPHATAEFRLVRRYRENPNDRKVLQAFLDAYDLDNSFGHPSRKKAIKHLHDTLNTSGVTIY